MSNGENWQFNRNFSMAHLSKIGLGTKKFEDRILFEINHLIEEVKIISEGENASDALDSLNSSIKHTILNVLYAALSTGNFFTKGALTLYQY